MGQVLKIATFLERIDLSHDKTMHKVYGCLVSGRPGALLKGGFGRERGVYGVIRGFFAYFCWFRRCVVCGGRCLKCSRITQEVPQTTSYYEHEKYDEGKKTPYILIHMPLVYSYGKVLKWDMMIEDNDGGSYGTIELYTDRSNPGLG